MNDLIKQFGDEGTKLLEGFPKDLAKRIAERNSDVSVTAYSIDGKLKWKLEKKDE